ncbi:hypothetical protein, partial [Klebsiella michiganensis]|uniref:hypothetical protein n=1 Tax=Klebsiella michiganensis TaxID=1134687 RepID=UPI0019534A89
FWKTFVPAAAGSAGSQIAVFADTIIASFLVDGAVEILEHPDRDAYDLTSLERTGGISFVKKLTPALRRR